MAGPITRRNTDLCRTHLHRYLFFSFHQGYSCPYLIRTAFAPAFRFTLVFHLVLF